MKQVEEKNVFDGHSILDQIFFLKYISRSFKKIIFFQITISV